MRKIMLTVMVLLVTAMITTTALAVARERGPGYGPCGWGEFGGFSEVNLTADQRTKLNELRDAHFKDIKSLQERMFAKRDELRKLWLETNPDQGRITAAQKETRSVRDQWLDKMTTLRFESLKVLTPVQREKAKSFAAGYSAGRRIGPGRGFEKYCAGSDACGDGGCKGGKPVD
jgi:Spy/CpxP family protein refolding chaperone